MVLYFPLKYSWFCIFRSSIFHLLTSPQIWSSIFRSSIFRSSIFSAPSWSLVTSRGVFDHRHCLKNYRYFALVYRSTTWTIKKGQFCLNNNFDKKFSSLYSTLHKQKRSAEEEWINSTVELPYKLLIFDCTVITVLAYR